MSRKNNQSQDSDPSSQASPANRDAPKISSDLPEEQSQQQQISEKEIAFDSKIDEELTVENASSVAESIVTETTPVSKSEEDFSETRGANEVAQNSVEDDYLSQEKEEDLSVQTKINEGEHQDEITSVLEQPKTELDFRKVKRHRKSKRRSHRSNSGLSVGKRLLIALRLDDYQLLNSRQRWEHFLWILGMDRSPFRERGWIIIFLILGLFATSIWLSNPTKWEIYRNWRAEGHIKRAIASLAEGHKNAAQLHLRNAYRHTPENPEVLRMWIDTTAEQNSSERLGVLLQLYDITPSGDIAAEIVEAFLREQQVGTAAGYATRKLTLYPQSGKLWGAAGKAFLLQQRLHVAEAAFQRAAEILPEDNNVKFHQALISVLKTPSDQTPNFTYLESFRNIPELRETVTRTLTSLYLSTDPDRANSLIESAIAENPGEWDFLFLRFRTQLENKEKLNDEKFWEEIWGRAASLEQRLGIISEALRHDKKDTAGLFLDRLDNEDRRHIQTQWVQSLIHVMNEDWSLALDLARKALDKSGVAIEWEIRFHCIQALAHLKLNNPRESRISYNEAVRRAGENPQLNIFLSELLLRLNLQEFARDSFQRTASIDSTLREAALQRLFSMYLDEQNWEKMLDTIARLQSINPTNNNYITTMASMMLVSRKTDHAILKNIRSSDVDRTPLSHDALLLIAHAYAQAKELNKASNIIRKIESSHLDYSNSNLHLVATLAYLNRKEDALNAYSHLLQKNTKLLDAERKYLEELIED